MTWTGQEPAGDAVSAALYALDDLRIISAPLLDDSQFTLCAVLRNEIYFLGAFLAHYRKLGVERFVLLDDGSTDGTLQLLLEQPDVLVVASDRRYGDQIDLPRPLGDILSNRRILYIWRALLLQKFTKNRWAVQVDLDEFIHLPPGMTFQDLGSKLDDEGAAAVWAVMLDMYPSSIADLVVHEGNTMLDPEADWYFDGQEHLSLQAGNTPRMVYAGARARLFQKFGISRKYHEHGLGPKRSFLNHMKKTRFGRKVLDYNLVHKPVLTKWQDGGVFFNSHETNLPASQRFLLPMQHFRFTASLYGRVEMALAEKSYSSGSRDHVFLSMLLQEMEQRDASFLYRKSRLFRRFEDFTETLNAKGF